MLRRADDLLSGPLPLMADEGRLTDVPPRRRLPTPHLWALLLIAAFGGLLRFYHLTFPALWNDETLVFWRVCGTYGQMLGPLHTDGFPPLHYSLYWLLGHPVAVAPEAGRAILGWAAAALLSALAGLTTAAGLGRASVWVRRLVPFAGGLFVFGILAAVAVRVGPGWLIPRQWVPAQRTLQLTPWVIRSVPAICGTLNIPAMYFLARQLVPRGTALVAALVTACSAFMLFYSRDAKMYPDAWLLITLNVGCLLVWFRTGRSTPFLAWVATGCGAVGLHPSAYAVPALSVVFLLTQRRLTWQRSVAFVVGLGVIYSGILVYFTMFNVWNERVEALGWSASGLGWVGGFFNGNRTGPEHVAYTASAFLSGYEWPRDDYLPQIIQSLQDVPQAVMTEIAAVLAVAVLPWPLLRAMCRPDRQVARDRAAPEPAWRVWLWLGVWIAVPTYGVYCHSVDGFVSPARWLWELREAVSPVQWTLALAAVETLAVASYFYRPMRPMVRRLLGFWIVTAALFGLCLATFLFAYPASMKAFFANRPWGLSQSVWEPRYLGFMWPAVGMGVAGLLMRLPTRAVRVAAVTFFCAANLFIAGMRMVLWTEPPIDRLAADVWAAQRPDVRTYDNIRRDGIEVAGTSLGVTNQKIAGGRYYLQMLADRQPMSPTLFEHSLWPDFHHPYVLRERLDPGAVRFDLRHDADQVRRIILWTQLFTGDRLAYDPYRSALPKDFRLTDEAVYPVRVVWDWREKWRWVRREYVRTAPPKR